MLAAWAKQAGAEGKVTMLADGNGDFAEALGLAADFSKFGMGKRGQRWSAIVEDGVVKRAQRRGARRVQRVERGVPLGAALIASCERSEASSAAGSS